jgi:hypothetical protein
MGPTFWQSVSPAAASQRQSSIVPFARLPDNLDHFSNITNLTLFEPLSHRFLSACKRGQDSLHPLSMTMRGMIVVSGRRYRSGSFEDRLYLTSMGVPCSITPSICSILLIYQVQMKRQVKVKMNGESFVDSRLVLLAFSIMPFRIASDWMKILWRSSIICRMVLNGGIPSDSLYSCRVDLLLQDNGHEFAGRSYVHWNSQSHSGRENFPLISSFCSASPMMLQTRFFPVVLLLSI